MAVYRVSKRENPFVQIDKYGVNDPSLSWKAKGILVYLLSKPDDWVFWEKDIINHATDGRDSVRAGLKELERNGYIVRNQSRDEQGRFGDSEFIVFERPQSQENKEVLPQTENPSSDKSSTGKASTENPTHTNNDLTNNNLTNKYDDEAHVREISNLAFQKWANKRELPNEIIQEIATLIEKENVEFDEELFDSVLDKTLTRYTKGKTGPFSPYFVGALKKENTKNQLALIEKKAKSDDSKSNKKKQRNKKSVPDYIWLQVERDRQEEKKLEQAQLEKSEEELNKDFQEAEQLIKELSSKTN